MHNKLLIGESNPVQWKLIGKISNCFIASRCLVFIVINGLKSYLKKSQNKKSHQITCKIIITHRELGYMLNISSSLEIIMSNK